MTYMYSEQKRHGEKHSANLCKSRLSSGSVSLSSCILQLAETMAKWGVTDWQTNNPRGARSTVYQQTEKDRTVELTYVKQGKTVTLRMGKQMRAVDNLRVLYLAVESMRMNEKRGIGDVLESAYLQLASPAPVQDPYEVLEIRDGASLDVAEAAWKAKIRNNHPDRGGSEHHMKILNQAIEEIRKKAA